MTASSSNSVPSIIYAQADDDIATEARVYAKCIGCHLPAYNRIGPKHCGLLGQQAGSEAGFTYRTALKNLAIVWAIETQDLFLKAPLEMVPGTSMGFPVFPHLQNVHG